eukprot:scaffold1330_cov240-Pinguiococcus_pyrenoidosus.AAC.37
MALSRLLWFKMVLCRKLTSSGSVAALRSASARITFQTSSPFTSGPKLCVAARRRAGATRRDCGEKARHGDSSARTRARCMLSTRGVPRASETDREAFRRESALPLHSDSRVADHRGASSAADRRQRAPNIENVDAKMTCVAEAPPLPATHYDLPLLAPFLLLQPQCSHHLSILTGHCYLLIQSRLLPIPDAVRAARKLPPVHPRVRGVTSLDPPAGNSRGSRECLRGKLCRLHVDCVESYSATARRRHNVLHFGHPAEHKVRSFPSTPPLPVRRLLAHLVRSRNVLQDEHQCPRLVVEVQATVDAASIAAVLLQLVEVFVLLPRHACCRRSAPSSSAASSNWARPCLCLRHVNLTCQSDTPNCAIDAPAFESGRASLP